MKCSQKITGSIGLSLLFLAIAPTQALAGSISCFSEEKVEIKGRSAGYLELNFTKDEAHPKAEKRLFYYKIYEEKITAALQDGKEPKDRAEISSFTVHELAELKSASARLSVGKFTHVLAPNIWLRIKTAPDQSGSVKLLSSGVFQSATVNSGRDTSVVCYDEGLASRMSPKEMDELLQRATEEAHAKPIDLKDGASQEPENSKLAAYACSSVAPVITNDEKSGGKIQGYLSAVLRRDAGLLKNAYRLNMGVYEKSELEASLQGEDYLARNPLKYLGKAVAAVRTNQTSGYQTDYAFSHFLSVTGGTWLRVIIDTKIHSGSLLPMGEFSSSLVSQGTPIQVVCYNKNEMDLLPLSHANAMLKKLYESAQNSHSNLNIDLRDPAAQKPMKRSWDLLPNENSTLAFELYKIALRGPNKIEKLEALLKQKKVELSPDLIDDIKEHLANYKADPSLAANEPKAKEPPQHSRVVRKKSKPSADAPFDPEKLIPGWKKQSIESSPELTSSLLKYLEAMQVELTGGDPLPALKGIGQELSALASKNGANENVIKALLFVNEKINSVIEAQKAARAKKQKAAHKN